MSAWEPPPVVEPGQLWTTSKGRTVEIVAVDDVQTGDYLDEGEVTVLAYRYIGGSILHLRSARSLSGWSRVEFE